MAKKKEKKEEEGKQYKYHSELMGLLLLLIAIIGLGDFGPIGKIISGFAIFIAGSWYQPILIFVFCVGIYMIIHRESPNFFTGRLVGLYILFIAVLIFSHLNYVKLHIQSTEVIKETVNQLLLAFKDKYHEIDAGGGIIGALLAITLVKLFADGSLIIVFALFIFGIIMLSNISLSETLKWIVANTKTLFKKLKFINGEKGTIDKDHGEDKKIVISSIEELSHIKDEDVDKVDEMNDELQLQTNVSTYRLPPITLLNYSKYEKNDNQGMVKSNIEILERVLKDFDISGKIVEVHVGPSVTQYELELQPGIRVNRVLSINKEIALALAAKDVRIQLISGKNTIGIEIPNKVSTIVPLREVISSVPNIYNNSKLLVSLGKDIMGKSVYAEINKMPHLLVSGATGSGKSVCINTIIISILMRARPDEVKFVLIDPKKVELVLYNDIPHLFFPVVTDPKKASVALIKIVNEMENRYELFNKTETKNITSYNQYVDRENQYLPDDKKLKKLPYIVVIIDELADLMLITPKEVEDSIMRITQMARAAGIHLIVATQRPSIDVITGIIKANIPSRISFAVSSNVDSRTILDMGGAEKLLGKGDMLFLPLGESTPIRLQGCFVSETEVKRVVDYITRQQKVKYDEKAVNLDEDVNYYKENKEEDDDPLYNEIVEFAIKTGKISASRIQRKFRLGYNRAARIIDLLEERGIVGPPSGSKPREVLVKFDENENKDS